MILTVLIVVVCLWAMTIAGGLFLVRMKNPSSTPPSPTPPTTPTPPSDTVATQMVTTMADAMTSTMREMHEMVVDMTQGRPSQNQTGPLEMPPISNEKPLVYDYDSTPLSGGIEAVLAREERETEQARLLRERAELQSKLAQTQAEWDSLTEADPTVGPWTQSDPEPT